MEEKLLNILISLGAAALVALLKPLIEKLIEKFRMDGTVWLSLTKWLDQEDQSPEVLKRRLQILHIFEAAGIFGTAFIVGLLWFDAQINEERLPWIGGYIFLALFFWVLGFIATFNVFMNQTPLIRVTTVMTIIVYLDLALLYFLVSESGGPRNSVFAAFYPAFPILTIQFVNFGKIHMLVLPLATLGVYSFSIWSEQISAAMTAGHVITTAIPVLVGSVIGFYKNA